MSLKNKIKVLISIAFSIIYSSSFAQSSSKFKIVLDPGHGGKDNGTLHNNYVEKKIVLAVALKVGKILEKNPNFEVLYTRKTDVFIELMERANIANKAKANFFVSIHCNGVKDRIPLGTETYVMGLTKNESNLEVAKRENEVITLESNYKLKYNDFDPNVPESMIGIKLLQEEYIDQSITLATKIQDNFTSELNRKNRGVKQGPILVLNQSAMPSVLIELGFVSNKVEGAYLNSERGQNKLAKSIADAIVEYQSEYFRNNIVLEKVSKPKSSIKGKGILIEKTDVTTSKTTTLREEIKEEESKVDMKEIVFKIQIAAVAQKIDTKNSPKFKGLKDISFIYEKGLYKYMYGVIESYDTAKKELLIAKNKGFINAFIVAFKNEKKISMQEALK